MTDASFQIAADIDDVEEIESNGDVVTDSSDLEFVLDGGVQQLVGLRFTSVTIPQGATITDAYIKFQADESQSVQTDLTFQTQASDDAPAFDGSNSDVSGRSMNGSSVDWNSVPAWTTGNYYDTPDLSTIIQDVVDRAGWSSGNALVVVVTGSGHRTAESYGGTYPATLFVSYELASGLPGRNRQLIAPVPVRQLRI